MDTHSVLQDSWTLHLSSISPSLLPPRELRLHGLEGARPRLAPHPRTKDRPDRKGKRWRPPPPTRDEARARRSTFAEGRRG